MTLPHRIFNTDGSVWPGQDAGLPGPDVRSLAAQRRARAARDTGSRRSPCPPTSISARMGRRTDLLDRLRRELERPSPGSPAATYDEHARRALELLGSSAGAAGLSPGGRAGGEPGSLWRNAVRPERPAGPPAGRGGRPARAGQLVSRARRAAGQPLLGQPHQGIRPAQGRAGPAHGSGLLGAHRGPGPAGNARRDPGGLHGRVRPHAPAGRATAAGATGARSSRSRWPAAACAAARFMARPTASAPTRPRAACGPRTCRRRSSTAWATPPQASTATRWAGPTPPAGARCCTRSCSAIEATDRLMSMMEMRHSSPRESRAYWSSPQRECAI